MTKSVSLLYWW